ncbi:hypothetical protein SmJEL517_g04185 [Synchytrium microbalum]|uniref:NADH dehydrogenase [ubiquinone] 1 beta subcomplex subunit 8, mitochondrial n=1 Tax=Synchytrium microbalum TaxID=1806994 RepID=A0A507BZ27_9FUNG|nr:uncharacterized protein SmJEL517_g04185 [Synchytrium microbalum]TPX32682.1 hypothetical protein SmJEL517_g04185 [Synchytrium microbalum]
MATTWRLLRPILSQKSASSAQFSALRFASSNAKRDAQLDQYGPLPTADPFLPDPLKQPASDLWPTEKDLAATPAASQSTLPPHPTSSPDFPFFQHPLYIPLAQPKTGLGTIIPPLKWPVYDQSVLSAQQSNLPSPPRWWYSEFGNREMDPIGDYPRDVPMQWTQLRDPYKYWDQQGRREYGEIMYDHDNYTDFLGIGPEVHWWVPFMGMMKAFGFIGLVAFGVAWYDPSAHMLFTDRDYPHDGLRVELGGNPEEHDDNWMAARKL